MVFSSLGTIAFHKTDRESKQKYSGHFYKSDSRLRSDVETANDYDWETALPSWGYYYQERIDETLRDINDIVNLCSKNGIKLIVFTNPVHKITYQKSVDNGYLDFLYKLPDITDYYNFSGLNDITVNNNNYLETSHYSLEIGDMIIDTIFHSTVDNELLSQGFGYYVTKNNKDEFIDILRNQHRE